MATPTNLPGSFSVGQTLTSAQMNSLRGAFRVLQVVYGVTTTAVGASSSTYIDTGLSASITPQSTSSKILVIVNHSTYTLTAGTTGGIQLFRNSTSLQTFLDVGYNPGGNLVSTWATSCLDSPATTSALTYKTQQNRGLGAGYFYTQVNSNPGTIVLMEVSA